MNGLVKREEAANELAKLIPQIMNAMSVAFDKVPPPDITLSPSHMRILYLLEQLNSPVKMSELSSRLGITQGTLSTTIKKLLAKKYASRERSTRDERVVFVTVTAAGKKLLKKNDENLKKIFTIVAQNMSQAGLSKFLEAHRTIVAVLNETQVNINFEV